MKKNSLIPLYLDGHFEVAIVICRTKEKVLVCAEKWLWAWKVFFRGKPRWIHEGDIYNTRCYLKNR